jgi:exopolysaccharide biosynthesis protein
MTKRLSITALLLFVAAAAMASWTNLAPGVDYQEFAEPGFDVHVARIDLAGSDLAVIGSRESERGLRVSELAKKTNAIVAINGDYFDDRFRPVGLALGPCGKWDARAEGFKRREGLVELAQGRAQIVSGAGVEAGGADDWAQHGISGWPMLVDGCVAATAQQLPGSDVFTRSPHPRTAVGLSKDGKTLYLVVADGRRSGVPGMTLAELASFFTEKLGACSAINLDGGGSTTMTINGKIVNRPSDGVERPVGNHLAVILRKDLASCDPEPAAKLATAAKYPKPAPPPVPAATAATSTQPASPTSATSTQGTTTTTTATSTQGTATTTGSQTMTTSTTQPPVPRP